MSRAEHMKGSKTLRLKGLVGLVLALLLALLLVYSTYSRLFNLNIDISGSDVEIIVDNSDDCFTRKLSAPEIQKVATALSGLRLGFGGVPAEYDCMIVVSREETTQYYTFFFKHNAVYLGEYLEGCTRRMRGEWVITYHASCDLSTLLGDLCTSGEACEPPNVAHCSDLLASRGDQGGVCGNPD